jgi:hypothetical protein
MRYSRQVVKYTPYLPNLWGYRTKESIELRIREFCVFIMRIRVESFEREIYQWPSYRERGLVL